MWGIRDNWIWRGMSQERSCSALVFALRQNLLPKRAKQCGIRRDQACCSQRMLEIWDGAHCRSGTCCHLLISSRSSIRQTDGQTGAGGHKRLHSSIAILSHPHTEKWHFCANPRTWGTKRNFSFYPVVKICRIHSLSLWLSRERRREMDEKGTRNKNKTQIKAMGLRKWPCLGGRKLGVPSIVMMSKGCPQGLLEGTGQSLIPAA